MSLESTFPITFLETPPMKDASTSQGYQAGTKSFIPGPLGRTPRPHYGRTVKLESRLHLLILLTLGESLRLFIEKIGELSPSHHCCPYTWPDHLLLVASIQAQQLWHSNPSSNPGNEPIPPAFTFFLISKPNITKTSLQIKPKRRCLFAVAHKTMLIKNSPTTCSNRIYVCYICSNSPAACVYMQGL